DQHLTGTRAVKVDLHDLKRLSSFNSNGGTCSQWSSPLMVALITTFDCHVRAKTFDPTITTLVPVLEFPACG
ncbi:hypothetical protein DFP92_1011039, partial [Yoonia sediminilitoris]